MITFLEEYKNPCWVEELPWKPFEYSKEQYDPWRIPNQFGIRMGETNNTLLPILHNRQRRAIGTAPFYTNGTRTRCLPYFLLAGLQKAGTTDLYEALTRHPLGSFTANQQ